ncbi:hypothetical protein Pcinc_034615 [Petrolisthes cinctipes]|uniref:Uncharacterized protein n=1 Tax=Petrolisthes cinctipes TaxID=88211 RepID=A0AAE1BYE3_PETCI|nr:hypothetical protein Pcinc_034615 [Petrolisthes cinctipes]
MSEEVDVTDTLKDSDSVQYIFSAGEKTEIDGAGDAAAAASSSDDDVPGQSLPQFDGGNLAQYYPHPATPPAPPQGTNPAQLLSRDGSTVSTSALTHQFALDGFVDNAMVMPEI